MPCVSIEERQEYNRQYYRKNKVKMDATSAAYNLANANKRKEYDRKRQTDNREEMLNKSSKYYLENSTEMNKQSAEYYRDNRTVILKNRFDVQSSNPELALFRGAKAAAKRTGKDFEITLQDVVIPEVCPMLGIKLQFSLEKKHPGKPSLDRIDSSKGYVKGNVQVISWKANMIKNCHAALDLVAVGQFMLDNGQ